MSYSFKNKKLIYIYISMLDKLNNLEEILDELVEFR